MLDLETGFEFPTDGLSRRLSAAQRHDGLGERIALLVLADGTGKHDFSLRLDEAAFHGRAIEDADERPGSYLFAGADVWPVVETELDVFGVENERGSRVAPLDNPRRKVGDLW